MGGGGTGGKGGVDGSDGEGPGGTGQGTTTREFGESVDRLDGKVTALEGKPGKRWDNLVEKLIWAVVAAVAGFFLAQIGLG